MSDSFCIETRRLRMNWLQLDDAAFLYRLVNDPDWLRHIGDRQVKDLEAARTYIENGMRAMYRNHGFGLNRVALKDCDKPIGICGLLRRERIPDIELGYALLPQHRGQGYALEAARAVLDQAFEQLQQSQVCAIVSADNRTSITLLEKLGFRFDRTFSTEPNTAVVDLYSIQSKNWKCSSDS